LIVVLSAAASVSDAIADFSRRAYLKKLYEIEKTNSNVKNQGRK